MLKDASIPYIYIRALKRFASVTHLYALLAARQFISSIVGRAMGGIAMSAELKSRFRAGAKVCSLVIVVLLVIAALGPAKWAPRTELGWQFDHFIGYFGITLFFCFAWPRPLVVGGIIMTVAASLESLQALTPDRSANVEAALWGAGGALAAALVTKLFIRARRWRLKSARPAKVFPQKSRA
jgi:VanZ family protein